MINAFEKIICKNVVIQKHGIDKKEWHIKESGSDSKIRKLILTSIPNKSFAFTLDHESKSPQYKQLSCYLNKSTKNINKGCDLVIVTQDNSNNIIIDLVDLKSNKIKYDDIEKQLGNSEVFIKYLCHLIKYHYSLNNNIDFRKTIIFTGRKIVSKNLTYKGNSKQSARDEILRISVKPIRKTVRMHFGKLKNG